jgi:hypothetical protein
VLTVARMTPEEAPLIPEPARRPNGTFAAGESGNPGGIPRRARKFQRGSAEASNIALDLLLDRLRTARDNPMKVVQGPDGKEWLEPTMADKDVVAALGTLAKHGGLIPPAEMARLLLDARKTLESPEEWDRFAGLIDPEYGSREAIEAAPDPDAEEDVLP